MIDGRQQAILPYQRLQPRQARRRDGAKPSFEIGDRIRAGRYKRPVPLMKSFGVIAPHTACATSLLHQEIDDQFQSRFGAAPRLPFSTHRYYAHGIEMAIRRQDLPAIVALTTSAAKRAGEPAVLLGGSAMHVAAAAVASKLIVFDLAEAALQEAATYKGIKRAGLIGTRLKAEEEHWITSGRMRGLAVQPANPAWRARIQPIVDELCAGTVSETRRTEVAAICAELQRGGAEIIISVVAELRPLLRPHDVGVPVIHAIESQVARAIAWSTGI